MNLFFHMLRNMLFLYFQGQLAINPIINFEDYQILNILLKDIRSVRKLESKEHKSI